MVAGPTPARRRSPFRRLVGLLGVGVGLTVALAGCSPKQAFRFGWPGGGITPQSNRMFDLWVGSTIAAFTVGIFVWGLIFWSIIRYRKRDDSDELPVQTRYNLPIEILYTVVPFLVVSVLFYYTAITESYVNKESKHPDVTVDVVAFKWNWEFQYPDAKDSSGQPVQTVGTSSYIPVLVVPTGKTIRFTEISRDVIHSFWVPELLFKRDVIPGLKEPNSFEVTIDRPGAYVGHCAELCGTYHSMMNFELRAVSPEQYDRFIAAKEQGMSTPDALGAAGFQGDQRFAVTTHPFNTVRNARTSS